MVTNGTFTSLADALKELKVSKDLTKVDLTNVDVRDAGLSDLLFGLRKQPKLKELILANCNLGEPSARHLTTFLKYNKTVTRLYLQHNKRLGDAGVEELAMALQSNKTLEVLNIANCNVGDIGAAAIAEKSGSIQKLYLYNNNIGGIGSSAISAMIQSNTTLLELFLWDNPLTQAGLDCLREAHKQVCKQAADSNAFSSPRLNLVVGLRNEKLAKKAKPTVKRNFVVPKDKESAAAVDTSKPGMFGDLRAKAQSLAGETSETPPPATPSRQATERSTVKNTIMSNSSIRKSSPPLAKTYGQVGPSTTWTAVNNQSSSSPPMAKETYPIHPKTNVTSSKGSLTDQTRTCVSAKTEQPLGGSSSSDNSRGQAVNEDLVVDEIALLEAEIAALEQEIQIMSN